MAQALVSVESRNSGKPLGRERRGMGFRWSITWNLVGLVAVFGLLVLFVVSQVVVHALRGQMDRRASDIASNLADAAAGHVLRKNALELHVLVSKYALLEGVAYVFIEDRKGEVIAHTLGTFPPELREPASSDELNRVRRRALMFEGKRVKEARVPILEALAGAVHVGILEEAVEKEIQQVLLPLLGLLAIVVLVAAALSALVARRVTRPILRLARIAGNMSKGDVDTPIAVEFTGEIGELADSLERMRASLKAAMVRLSREHITSPAEKDGEEKGEQLTA